MTVYLMEVVQGVSKAGNNYTRAVLMDEKGRRQSFFLTTEQTKEVLANKEMLSASMTELIPLEADIDPFGQRLLSLEAA